MPLYSERNTKRLDGKCVAITGANTGIGKETVLDLSKRGAKVLMLCRNQEKSQPVVDEIKAASGNEVIFYKLDLASLKSVRECADAIRANEEKIDILINNAGVMICPQSSTEDGFDMQFGTNHLGHFLLTELLLPLVKNSAASGFHPRIVIVSSMAHETGQIYWDDVNMKNNYNEAWAYCQSKLANIMHGKELARRLKGTGITVYSLHPGIVKTELQRHSNSTWYWNIIIKLTRPFYISPIKGAQTTLYCALEDKIENDSGLFYSGCRERRPQRRALIEEDQKRLWDLSEKMVGLAGDN